MKRYLSHLVILAGLFALMLMNSPSAQSDNDKADKADQPEKLLRHVVLFKFKESATQQQIDEVVKGFGELPEKIDAIHDYEWGTNNSPEDHAKGYTHCFLVTFKSEADRDAYLPHPAHQEFVKILLPILDEVHVVDYWAQR
jgi:hypothetical protein